MLDPTSLSLSGERILAVYDFHGPSHEVAARARAVSVEQTIEFPADLLPDDDIKASIVGRVESLVEITDDTTRVTISYAAESTGFELPQLLNVLFGNSSLLTDLRLVDIGLPPSIEARLTQPRFGVSGLRELLGVPSRPLLATALKPMGQSPQRLAQSAYELAAAGIDLVKDDHSLANQPFAEFTDRVRACAEAVRRANHETGGRSLYLPSINAPYRLTPERLAVAKQAGVGGLLVLPGITGFDLMAEIASDPEIDLPIMAHPALLGGFVSSPTGGMAHGLLLGKLMRIAGADMSVFPNYGGRFSFSPAACSEIADACREPFGGVRPIWPTPGGGMTVERIGEIVDFYGSDVVLLIGGDLHRSDNLRRRAEQFRAAIE